ncbi:MULTISPECIES: hypothetical protein [Streptomyces]|nr:MULTISPECIES: hypothetical protein [Streptomyces]
MHGQWTINPTRLTHQRLARQRSTSSAGPEALRAPLGTAER